MTFRKFLPATLFTLGACGAASTCDVTGPVRFDASVPSEQACLIDQDIQTPAAQGLALTRMRAVAPDAAEGLQAWLAKRINTVVGQDFDMSKLKLTDRRAVYPHNDEATLASFEKINRSTRLELGAHASREVTMMAANLGCAAYAAGKMEEPRLEPSGEFSASVVAIELDGELRPVESSRAGIMLIGEGYFSYGVTKDPEATAGRLARLATLVHEARHSDGHGHSLCFQHVICPPWHDFAGHAACDVPANGAYAVGSAFLEDAIENCVDCSETEREQLRMIAADQMSRQVDLGDRLVVSEESGQRTVSDLTASAQRGLQTTSNDDPKQRFLRKFLDFVQSNQGQGEVTWDDSPETEGLKFLR